MTSLVRSATCSNVGSTSSRAAAKPGETFYRALLERSDAATLVVDAVARIVYANRAAGTLSGHAPERLRNMALRELIVAGPSSATLNGGGLRRWLRECRDETADHAFAGRTAEAARVDLIVRCRRVDLGRRKFYVLTLRDAGRHAGELNEKFLRSVIATAGDAIVAADARHVIRVFNPAAERIFGYAADEVVGRNLDCLMPARFRAAHGGHVRGFAGAAQPARLMGERGRVVGLRKDGTEFPAEASISRFAHDGQPTYIVVLRDIGDRIQADEALRQSEARLANAQRIARLGNWDWDVVTDELVWSDEAYRILGYDKQKCRPTHAIFLAAVHPDDRDAVELAVADLACGADDSFSMDYRIVRPDGAVRAIHEQGEVTRDGAGRAIRMTGIVQDITERREIERSLNEAKLAAEAASRAKSDFLANMSHELRTPLNAIIGFSEVMVRELYGAVQPDKYKDYCQQIFDSGQHLLDLINGLLDMARIEAGKIVMDESPVDVASLMRACRTLFAERAERAGLALDCVCDEPVPRLIADARMLRQVLFNLLSNAVKFTPPGGRIVLRAAREDGGIALSVADTGPGMAEDDVVKAFEPFGQVDASLSRKHGGAGLGLAISKSLVELHQGRLRMDTRLGVGTVVTAWFPSTRALGDSCA